MFEEAPFDWIVPDWPAPAHVRALSTTRSGGFSSGTWASLNLGTNSEDDPGAVCRNRNRLEEYLPGPPRWLQQVHGVEVADDSAQPGACLVADAIVSRCSNKVCTVLTADCLPVLFCSRNGDRVAAAHAGWRGLAGGILEATVDSLDSDPEEILAWLGPAIGPGAYEVGEDVVDAFPHEFPRGFRSRGNRWLMDLYELARLKLKSAGIHFVYGGQFCTFSDDQRFFSYRRDGVTGRMASMVWMDERENRPGA